MRRRGWGLGGLLFFFFFFPLDSIFPSWDAPGRPGTKRWVDGQTDSPSSLGVPNPEDSRGAGVGPIFPHSLWVFLELGGVSFGVGAPRPGSPPRGRGAVLIGLLRGAGKRSHDSLIAVFIQIVSRQLQTLRSPHIGDPNPGQI